MQKTFLGRACRLTAASLVALPLLVGCSSDDSSDGGSGGGASGDQPLTLGLLMSVKGEDAYSLDDYFQGASLAIEQINADGGYNGQPIESFRVPGPSGPTELTASLLDAASQEPDVLIGASSPQLAAISRQVDSVGIPIIGTSSYAISNGYAAGSQWVFMALASDENTVDAAARYAVEGLGGENIAVLHTNESFGMAGSESLEEFIPAAGGTILTDQSFPPDATDLTGPLLAANDADVFVSWAYPAPQAAGVNELANRGDARPTVGNAGLSSSVANGIITDAALPNIYSTVPCNSQGDRPATQDFVAAFQEKFGSDPSYISAQTYDSVYLAVEAAKAADSLEPDDMLAALESVEFSDGVCAAEYKADKEHVLVHDVTIVGFAAGDTTPVTKEVYSFDPGA